MLSGDADQQKRFRHAHRESIDGCTTEPKSPWSSAMDDGVQSWLRAVVDADRNGAS
jgi:hypothetical protein